MRLGWIEKWLINNPLREFVQKVFEGRQLLRLGGIANRAKALEIGCGSGNGIDILLDSFKVREVDAFDIDFDMLKRSKTRHSLRSDTVKLWVGNTRQIPITDATYDAVFDNLFNIHFKGVYFLIQKAIPIMKDNGGYIWAKSLYY